MIEHKILRQGGRVHGNCKPNLQLFLKYKTIVKLNAYLKKFMLLKMQMTENA